jgi:hypothetical protein
LSEKIPEMIEKGAPIMYFQKKRCIAMLLAGG